MRKSEEEHLFRIPLARTILDREDSSDKTTLRGLFVLLRPEV